MKKEKLKLSPYEIMTMMGATDPKLSEKLKNALDVEIANPEYEDLEMPEAVAKALNSLARKKPESFDQQNRDDMAALHLAPLTYDENGRKLDPSEVMSRVDLGSLQLSHVDRGDHLEVEMTASNDDENMQVNLLAKKETPTEVPDDDFHVPVVQRFHSNPADQSLEQAISRLKARVLDEADFAASFSYFLDETDRDPRFIKLGKAFKKAPNLKMALQSLAARVFPGETPRVNELHGLHLKRHAFLHGSVFLNGRIANFFFFQDLNYGMVAIKGQGDEVTFSRLTVVTKRKPK